jgi:acyl dehydratase
MAYVVNALMAWAGGDPAAIRGLQVRFQGNVLAGDHVTAGGEVTEVREEDGQRIVICSVWLDRDDGARLLAGTAEVTLA